METISGSSINESEVRTAESKFNVPVHWIINSMQKQHGIIPHQDYTQYRKYCTRKLHRLRHAKDGVIGRELLHGSGGRGKHASTFISRQYFNKTPLPSKEDKDTTAGVGGDCYYDKVHHVNFLLVLLVSAERCWSFAMEIKDEYDEMNHTTITTTTTTANKATTLYNKKKKTSLGKLRKQFLNKLRKAAEYATSLQNMVVNISASSETMLECQAYASWMRGNVALERNIFDQAANEYSEALKGIQVLKQLAHDLEMQDYFSSRAEYTIEPLKAYCQHELQHQFNSGDLIAGAIVPSSATTTTSTNNLLVSRLLQYKLEDKLDETRRAETTKSDSKYGTIVYRGITFSVDNEDLRMMLCKIDELVKTWKQQQSNNNNNDETTIKNENDENFVKLLSAYDEAAKFCSFQMKELEKMASGKSVNATKHVYTCLKGFLQHKKLVASMERNEKIAHALSSSSRSNQEEELKRMEELAHMYSLLLQDARMVTSLPSADSIKYVAAADTGAKNNSKDGIMVEDDDFALEAHAHVLRFRSFKCYYAAHLYSRKEKYQEALVLLSQAHALANQAIEELIACELSESLLVTPLEDLKGNVEKARCYAKASAYIAKLQQKKQASTKKSTPVLDRLDDFDAGDLMLFDPKPAMEFIPCKPTFFDIALNHVGEIPDLKASVDAYNESQTAKSGGLFGWLRRS